MNKLTMYLFVAGFLAAGVAGAQPTNCSDGTIVDDGSFESGYGWQPTVSWGSYVMRIDPPASPSRLDSVCLCWSRDGADTQVAFDVNVWDSNGAGGGPGTLLGRLSGQTASSVGNVGSFRRYDMSSLGLVINGPVYIGPSWQPGVDQRFFVCADENGPVNQPSYASSSNNPNDPPGAPTTSVSHNYRALGIRAKLSPVTAGNCVEDSTTLCLNNGRFQVRATFQTPAGQSGSAQVFKLTPDTGYLWFFNSSNVEAVVKVLNGCSLNSRYWVFAGGLTNVRVVLTVTDTDNGVTRNYVNPQNAAFQPIQDTSAFATCP